jgi:hypothetical protein
LRSLKRRHPGLCELSGLDAKQVVVGGFGVISR